MRLGIDVKYGERTPDREVPPYTVISEKLPKDVGLEPFCNWTAPLACKYVKEHYGVDFSERGMRDVFYRLKLSYTRLYIGKGGPSEAGSIQRTAGTAKKTP